MYAGKQETKSGADWDPDRRWKTPHT
uniref:Uncharacterized protein n=1 Tax=Anopheles minimus TaxID=112268 RepID=A0A182WN51_9DIPT